MRTSAGERSHGMSRQRAMKKQSRKRTRSVWMAAGTLAAYAAVRPSARALAAETVNGAATGAAAPATLPVRRFEIAPGPLGAVLEAYRAASGVKVNVPDAGLLQIPSPGVTGVMSVEVALKQLLVGTTVGFRFKAADLAELTLDASEALVVTGEAPLEISPKFTQPLLDTPQTISVVPQELMQEQANTTLREALRNVAGVSIAAGEGGFQGDSLTLRGFSARNDIYVDGMRDFGSYYRDPFHLQQVEVLKGPSSSEFGRGSTGGVINQSTKLPTMQSSMGASCSSARTRPTASRPTSTSRFRRSARARRSSSPPWATRTTSRAATSRRTSGGASRRRSRSASTARPSVTLAYFHLTAKDIPDYGVPWYFNEPAPVDRANYYGFEEGSFLDTSADMGTIRFSHEFTPNITHPGPGPLRQLRPQRPHHRGAPAGVRDAGDAARPDPGDAQPDRRREHGDVPPEPARRDVPVQDRNARPHARLRHRARPRDLRPDPPRSTPACPRRACCLPPERRVRRHAQRSPRESTATANTFAATRSTRSRSANFEVTAGFRWDRFDTDYAADGPAPTGALPRGRDAELARRDRLQAPVQRHDLLRRRDLVQSVRPRRCRLPSRT